MKNRYLVYIFILVFGVSACHSERESDLQKGTVEVGDQNEVSNESPVITFAAMDKDLGVLSEGEQVVTYFKYENTGDAPLIIQTIKAGCGCTVPEWNKEPLKPGDSEDIKVIFDTRGKRGNQNIRISVNSNARNSSINLAIKAVVTEIK